MRIMHVIDTMAVGGAQRMLVDIANLAADDGHHVSVCVTRAGTDMAGDLRPAIRLWELNRIRRFDWSATRRFVQLVREERIDVLHVHMRWPFAFLAMLKTLRLVAPPIVFHDHYGSIEYDRSVPTWFGLWGKRWVGQYVGVSATLGEWAAAAGVPADKINVIDNALDLARIRDAQAIDVRQAFGLAANRLVGIVTSGLRHDKGIDVLLEAIAKSDCRSAATVLVAGGAREADYVAACEDQRLRLGLADSVLFVGERQDAPGLMKSVDFAVIPSRSESGPLVLIEVMAAGVPLVATQTGSIAQRAAEAGVPEFVPPGDEAALASALDRLVSLSPGERAARGRLGREAAQRHFDIRQAMDQWYAVYERTLGPVS